MIQHPTQGETPARTGAAPAAGTRPGQVPHGDRPSVRLCFLSVPTSRAGAEVERDQHEAEVRRVAGLGFGIALGLDPLEQTRDGRRRVAEAVRRAGKLGLPHGFVAAAGGEQGGAGSIGAQIEELSAEVAAIEEAGGVPLLLPLASLSRRRATEAEYVEVYRLLLARISGPVLVDWTGPRMRPELLDYFPGKSFDRVMALDPAKVRGARLGLLDVTREVRLRRELLARDQLLFTSDRGHLAALLLGGNASVVPARVPPTERTTELAGRTVGLGDFSHAILADFDGEASALAAALERLAADDVPGYGERMRAL